MILRFCECSAKMLLWQGISALIVVGIDHNFLDLGPGSVASHERTNGNCYNEGKDYSQGQEKDHYTHIDNEGAHDTDQRHYISLESDKCEDKGIFDDLEEGEIKGDHDRVDIKSHNDPQSAYYHGHGKHNSVSEAWVCARREVVGINRVNSNDSHHKIKYSEYEFLL